jgi:hypothetical protein
MLKRTTSSALLLVCSALFLPPSSEGQFVLGVEAAQPTREYQLGRFTDEQTTDVLALFAGFDLGESVLYIGIRREDGEFFNGFREYQRRETTLEWHWNEESEHGNFISATVGVFLLDYRQLSFDLGDLLGLSVGMAGSRDLVPGLFFLSGGIKLKAPYDADADEEINGREPKFYFGAEARVAMGAYLGRDSPFQLQIGYRWQTIDFQELLQDDRSYGPFVALRAVLGY